MLEKGLVDKLMIAMLIALLLCGTGFVLQAVWQWATGNGGWHSAENLAADELSQREMHLQQQAQRLAETVIAQTDFRLVVNIDDSTSGARQITVVLDRRDADVSIEQQLRQLLWTGLALRKERGDRIVVQFREFAKSLADRRGDLRTPAINAVVWRGIAGLSVLLFAATALWLKWRRRVRDDNKLQELNDYQAQLLALKAIAKQEPARVAGVLGAWLNDERQ